jgi:hypothetical protein
MSRDRDGLPSQATLMVQSLFKSGQRLEGAFLQDSESLVHCDGFNGEGYLC